MKKSLLLIIVGLSLPILSTAQFSQEARDSINRVSRLDHQYMMEQLRISELRASPSGNPEAPNAANADESKVQSYTLPDPLVFEDGSAVETVADWQNRRKEIVELFDREMVGRIPENIPPVNWEVVSRKDTLEGDYPVTVKELFGHVDNSAYPEIEVNIELTLTTPAETDTADRSSRNSAGIYRRALASPDQPMDRHGKSNYWKKGGDMPS